MSPTKRKDNTSGARDAFADAPAFDDWDAWDTEVPTHSTGARYEGAIARGITEAIVPNDGARNRQDRKANRYAGACVKCGAPVLAEQGYLTKDASGRWAAEHKAGECGTGTPGDSTDYTPITTDAPEGFHTLDGEVFKVQIAHHGSGRPYAKRLIVGAEGERASWEYAAGMVKRLSATTLMSLAEAKAFGKLYGICVRCTAVLTDEGSIEAGIGPVCAAKWEEG